MRRMAFISIRDLSSFLAFAISVWFVSSSHHPISVPSTIIFNSMSRHIEAVYPLQPVHAGYSKSDSTDCILLGSCWMGKSPCRERSRGLAPSSRPNFWPCRFLSKWKVRKYFFLPLSQALPLHSFRSSFRSDWSNVAHHNNDHRRPPPTRTSTRASSHPSASGRAASPLNPPGPGCCPVLVVSV
ncbi:hypothetical protein BGZ61DRAFT_62422 [Ilyonectria robusta]|uniref:uncharacterized protein n=1 Tax=Ilyonectria robusta TaxID=1079257 RepID=UPI001E8D4C9E|nr:uncharacterized protein BGZ61DRAFT_62422 [Ilyonectria robusta]KAH8683455.1 hypothetical protein BGZ61DRAFT_62422 [Ilyonectria robusta]